LDPTLWVSVSATTRAPRPGEVPGQHYFFMSRGEFESALAAGEMLESAEFAGNLYGTPREPVRRMLAEGRSVLLEIELQGARQVREREPAAFLVFLRPPSFEELARRLRGRGTESAETVAHRLEIAREELAAESEFDAVVVNDDLQAAAERLLELVQSHT
jgi:guanylate kinase